MATSFSSVPADADAYILKSIIHDWMEPEARKILRVCRHAMGKDARVVLVGRVLEPPNEGLETKLSYLQMLVAAGGRERTHEERS